MKDSDQAYIDTLRDARAGLYSTFERLSATSDEDWSEIHEIIFEWALPALGHVEAKIAEYQKKYREGAV